MSDQRRQQTSFSEGTGLLDEAPDTQEQINMQFKSAAQATTAIGEL
jgi:hypothetical protein